MNTPVPNRASGSKRPFAIWTMIKIGSVPLMMSNCESTFLNGSLNLGMRSESLLPLIGYSANRAQASAYPHIRSLAKSDARDPNETE